KQLLALASCPEECPFRGGRRRLDRGSRSVGSSVAGGMAEVLIRLGSAPLGKVLTRHRNHKNRGGLHDQSGVAVAADPALGGDRVPGELSDPHDAAVARERLPEAPQG